MRKHDPQNPTDLLGQPIAKGDFVAWASKSGQSPALSVCQIDKIRFIREKPNGYGRNEECEQRLATDYQFYLRTVKTTGYMTYVNTQTGEWHYHIPEGEEHLYEPSQKSSRVQLVDNIVKLNFTEEQMLDLLHGGGWVG